MKPSAIHKASVGQCSNLIHLVYLTLLLQGTYTIVITSLLTFWGEWDRVRLELRVLNVEILNLRISTFKFSRLIFSA